MSATPGPSTRRQLRSRREPPPPSPPPPHIDNQPMSSVSQSADSNDDQSVRSLLQQLIRRFDDRDRMSSRSMQNTPPEEIPFMRGALSRNPEA